LVRFLHRLQLFSLVALLSWQASGAPAWAELCFPNVPLKAPLAQGGPRVQALPGHGLGKPLFLAIGFEPTQQANLEAGLTLAKQTAATAGVALALAELAIVEAQHEAYAAQIAPFMVKAVKQRQWLPYVYPVYTSKQALRQRLGLTPSQQVVYVLCDASGKRLWQQASRLPDATALDKALKGLP
jgi:hypothetical protein